MSQIIKESLDKNKGKLVTIFLVNGYRFYGKILNYDEVYVEILDYHTKPNKIKIIRVDTISQIDEEESNDI